MEVTKNDLRFAVTDIKEHISSVEKRMKDNIRGLEVKLDGPDGTSGIIGDVTSLKTTQRNVRWALGGGVAGVVAFFKSFMAG